MVKWWSALQKPATTKFDPDTLLSNGGRCMGNPNRGWGQTKVWYQENRRWLNIIPTFWDRLILSNNKSRVAEIKKKKSKD